MTSLPVEIEVLHVTDVGTGAVKGTHVADHWEHGGEGAVGSIEGDVEDGAGVDDFVDGLEGILGWGVSVRCRMGIRLGWGWVGRESVPRVLYRLTVL